MPVAKQNALRTNHFVLPICMIKFISLPLSISITLLNLEKYMQNIFVYILLLSLMSAVQQLMHGSKKISPHSTATWLYTCPALMLPQIPDGQTR